MNAWHEFNVANLTNPPAPDGTPTESGVALHVDVGELYKNYSLDFDGDKVVDLQVPFGNGPMVNMGPGDIDLDDDGTPDIGNLGVLGAGTVGGGRGIQEDSINRDLGPNAQNDHFGPGSDFADIRKTEFESDVRGKVFRYCLFAHFLDGEGGGVALGAECIVHMGDAAPQTYDANQDGVGDLRTDPLPGPPGATPQGDGPPSDGTFAEHTAVFLHEIGHTIGLNHGGEATDDVNFKPN